MDKEKELVSRLMKDCQSTRDIQPKLKRLFAGTIEQKIIAFYANAMSQRDIEDNLREFYGTDIPQTLIFKITDKILPEVNQWQNRPLETIYPLIYFDAIGFKSRKDSQIINNCQQIKAHY